MIKKIYLAAVVFVVLAQTGLAQTSTHISYTNHVVVLNDTCIWLEDKTISWNPLTYQGLPIKLYLKETNPAFFALVYNTLKDFMINQSGQCNLLTVPSSTGTHARITNVYVYGN